MRGFLLLSSLLLWIHAQEPYRLGEGLKIDETLYIGGYISTDIRHMDGSNRYRIDDIAFLGYGQKGKLSYLSELEFKEFWVKEKEKTTKNRRLYVERLYGSYEFDEHWSMSVGKFNSPLGIWNITPINVLRDTTSNPETTKILFPKFTTGLLLRYDTFDQESFSITGLLQCNKGISNQYNNYQTKRHGALSLRWEKERYTAGIDVGIFRTIEHETRYYSLLFFEYTNPIFKITSELGTQRQKNHFTTPYAFYLQGLYNVDEHNALIARVEGYRNNVTRRHDRFFLFGYTYRPIYPVAIKAEYQLHQESRYNQFLFSLSVMF